MTTFAVAGERAVWPDLLPQHLSPSSLKTYMACREQWRQQYLVKPPRRSKDYFVWGGAHNFALVETNYAQKIETHTDLPLAEVQEAFAAGVDRKINDEGGAGEIDWGESSAADIKDRGVALVTAYHKTVSPTVQPVAVEQRVTINVPGAPVPVVGYIDVVADRIIELKTAGKKGVYPGDIFQGRVYQLALPLDVDFHVATKTKVPGIYTAAECPEFGIPASDLQRAVTRRMVANLAADILATFDRFGPDETWPGAYATLASPCGRCSFVAACEWWSA